MSLYYSSTGPPGALSILFLHGFLGSHRDWDEVIQYLAERYFCIAIDLPGHSRSLGRGDEVYTWNGAARSVCAVIEQSGAKKPLIVGYSMGGRLALYLLVHETARWYGGVIESTSPGIQDPDERALADGESDRTLTRRMEEISWPAFLLEWYEQPLFYTLKKNDRLWRRLLDRRKQNDPHELVRALRGFSVGVQPSLWQDLPQLNTSLLTVVGEKDHKYVHIAKEMLF